MSSFTLLHEPGSVPYLGRMTTQAERWYEDPWTMGDRFRKAREHSGADQGQLAERLGISRNTVSNYETGVTTRPIRAIVTAWAVATGTTPEWLLTGHTSTGGGPGTIIAAAKGEAAVSPRCTPPTVIPFPRRAVPQDVPLPAAA